MVTYIKKQRLHISKAQSVIEYSVLIACVVAGLLAMQIYIKRSIEGRLRQASDEIGEHYAPEATTADITITRNTLQEVEQELVPLGRNDSYGLPIYGVKNKVSVGENITRSGSEELDEFEAGLF